MRWVTVEIRKEDFLKEPSKFSWDGEDALDSFTRDHKLLNISDIEEGIEFSGVVYCVKAKMRDNSYYSGFVDLVFQCIDGTGKVFEARQFKLDKAEIRDYNETPILISSGQMTTKQGLNGKSVVFYNLNEVNVYPSATLSLSSFLKKADNLTKEIDKLKSNLDAISNNNYKHFINELNDYGYFEKLKNTPYKQKLGTRIGMTIVVINRIIEIGEILLSDSGTKDDIELFKLVTYLYFTNDKLSERSTDFDRFSTIEDIASDITSASGLIYSLIGGSYLDTITKAKLLSILNNNPKSNSFRIGSLFNKTLFLVEEKIRIDEAYLLEKSQKVNSGYYLI